MPQLRHGFMDHADLGAVAVGDGELVIGFHKICKSFGSLFDCIPLLQSGITKRLMSEGDDCLFLIHIHIHMISH